MDAGADGHAAGNGDRPQSKLLALRVDTATASSASGSGSGDGNHGSNNLAAGDGAGANPSSTPAAESGSGGPGDDEGDKEKEAEQATSPKAQALTVQVALLTEEAEAKRLELQRAKDALDYENRSAAARAIELLRKKLASLADGIGTERSSARDIRANIQHLKQSQLELFDEEKKRLTLVRRGELEQKVFQITGRRIE